MFKVARQVVRTNLFLQLGCSLPPVSQLPVPTASHCSLSASQAMEQSRTLCPERGPGQPPLPVAADLPPCPSGPQANLACPQPRHLWEARATLPETRTVPQLLLSHCKPCLRGCPLLQPMPLLQKTTPECQGTGSLEWLSGEVS